MCEGDFECQDLVLENEKKEETEEKKEEGEKALSLNGDRRRCAATVSYLVAGARSSSHNCRRMSSAAAPNSLVTSFSPQGILPCSIGFGT